MKAKKCKSCLSNRKILKRCKECGKLCCSDCSINMICIDCFTKLNSKSEVNNYMHDKYNNGVLINE